MTRAEIIEQLKNEYRQNLARAEREQDARAAELEQADPQIRILWERQARLLTDAVRAMATNSAQAPQMAIRMREEGASILKEIEERTLRAGFDKDYAKMRYNCPVCKDKGVVDSGFCECFQRALNERMSSESRGVDSFESFKAEYIPDEPCGNPPVSQRRLTCVARDFLEAYANAFPAVEKRNVILYGQTGLGKTFLLNCVVRRLMERGIDVMQVTAYRMFEAMREKHMNGNGELFDRLLECEFLAIDDLGTEPMMRNITVEYLFMLLNERSNAKLATMIACNLTPQQMRERYGERIASRLFDRDSGKYFRFEGKDMRIKNG